MGAVSSFTILDAWRLEAHTGPGSYEQYLVTLLGGSAVTDYATGGQTVALPTKIKGAQFVSAQVLAVSALTRTWVWNGSQSAPKLIAQDAFATQEGAATTVNADTITAIITVKR